MPVRHYDETMRYSSLVLIGNAKEGTIGAYSLDGDALVHIVDSAVGAGCSTFAVDSARDLVYSATKEPEPAIVTLRLDRETGALSEVSRAVVPHNLAYLALTRDGALLLAASYHGGWGASWPVSDGVLGERSAPIEHANIHCVAADAAGHFAYFVSLGDDLVAQCRIEEDGSLTPLDEPAAHVAPGSGARHLILSADERSAYLMTEFTGMAIRFDRNPFTGMLEVAESVKAYDTTRGLTHSAFGADPQAGHLVWGADLHLTHDGRYLVCSERTESTLAAVGLDGDGRLTQVVAVTDTEAQPRGFSATPDGARLVVVGEGSGHAALHAIAYDGTFTVLDRVPTGAGPNWVRFA